MEDKKNTLIKTNLSLGGDYSIVMGDIIKSARYDYDELKIFRSIIDQINDEFELISPLTITLGDEFQGITHSISESIKIVFRIEEKLIREGYPFMLRYAIGYGEIITPINSDIAHGMYGDGLTKTRELLEKSKKDRRRRIDILLPNPKFTKMLNDLFFVYQSFPDNWNQKDYEIVQEFYDDKDYKVIAEKLGKRNDQIWRREKNLRIREFFSIQKVILSLSNILSILYVSEKQKSNQEKEMYSEIGDTIWNNINENKGQLSKSKFIKKMIDDKLLSNLFQLISDSLIP